MIFLAVSLFPCIRAFINFLSICRVQEVLFFSFFLKKNLEEKKKNHHYLWWFEYYSYYFNFSSFAGVKSGFDINDATDSNVLRKGHHYSNFCYFSTQHDSWHECCNVDRMPSCQRLNRRDSKQYSISRLNMFLGLEKNRIRKKSGPTLKTNFLLHGFFFVWSNSREKISVFISVFMVLTNFLLFSCSARLLLSLFIQSVFRPFKKAKTNTILFTDIEKNANFYYYYIYINIIRVHMTVLPEFRSFHSQFRCVYVCGILDKLTLTNVIDFSCRIRKCVRIYFENSDDNN